MTPSVMVLPDDPQFRLPGDGTAVCRRNLARLPTQIQRVARRKLLLLNQARRLNDLRAPPGNRLGALKGARHGQHSLRVNDQWRLCFRWQGADAYDVEIVDYH